MTRHAGIYLRISEDRTGKEAGVQRQLEDCQKLVDQRNWDLVDTYVDNDVSAYNGKKRPEFERLLEDIRLGRINAVVVWSPDRLIRRMIELERVVQIVEDYEVQLVNVQAGDLDLSTPYGRMTARIYGAIAQGEVEQKSARQKRANLQRAEQGLVYWTRRPFGYDTDDKLNIVVVEPEANEIRFAVERVLNGSTLAAIAKDFDTRGIKTSTGSTWNVSTLRKILLNPRYAGVASYKRNKVGKGVWPVIIEPEIQERLRLILTDPARRTQVSTDHKYLLSGIARCGKEDCGRKMFACPQGTHDGRYWMTYRCRTTHLHRRLDLVDNIVEQTLIGRFKKEDAVSLFIKDEADLDALRKESAALRERLDQLSLLLAEGVLTDSGVREASKKLKIRIDEIDRKIAATHNNEHIVKLITAKDVEKTWSNLPLKAKRAVIDEVAEVTILPAPYKGARFAPEQVRIEWRTT